MKSLPSARASRRLGEKARCGLLLCVVTVACSEGTDGPPSGFAPRRGDAATPDAGATSDDAGDAAAPDDDAHARAPSLGFVVNEIRAAGDDWIELLNGLPLPVDLSGHLVADREDDGSPKLDEAVTIPEGTTLAPGARLLVVADVAPAMPGWQTDCLDRASAMCLHAAFGISQGDGDSIFVLAPDRSIVVAEDYPPAAAPDGSSWARIPDGTGAFVVATPPTPGASNGP